MSGSLTFQSGKSSSDSATPKFSRHNRIPKEHYRDINLSFSIIKECCCDIDLSFSIPKEHYRDIDLSFGIIKERYLDIDLSFSIPKERYRDIDLDDRTPKECCCDTNLHFGIPKLTKDKLCFSPRIARFGDSRCILKVSRTLAIGISREPYKR